MSDNSANTLVRWVGNEVKLHRSLLFAINHAMKHSLRGRFSWRDIADYLPEDFTEGSIDQHLEKDRIKTMIEEGIVQKKTQRTKDQQKEDIRALAAANQSKVGRGRKNTTARTKKPAGRGRRRAKTPPSSSSSTLRRLLPAPTHIKESPKSPPSVFAVPPAPTRVLRTRPARSALPAPPQPAPEPSPMLRPAQPRSLAPAPPPHTPHGLYAAWGSAQVPPQALQAPMGSMDTDPYYQQQQQPQDTGFGGYGMAAPGVPQAQGWDQSFGSGMELVADSLWNHDGTMGLGIDFEGEGGVPDSAVELEDDSKMNYGWGYGGMEMANVGMGYGEQQQYVQPQALQTRYSAPMNMNMGWN